MADQGKPVVTLSREGVAVSVWPRAGTRDNGEQYQFSTFSLQVSWREGDQWRSQSVNLDMRQVLAAVVMLQQAAMMHGIAVKYPQQTGG